MTTKNTAGAFSWMSNPQYLAQVGHFFGALSLVLGSALFCTALNSGLMVVWWVFAVGTALAAFKEFVFDTANWGEGDSWADSAMDFTFYELGGVTGLGLTALAAYLK